MANEIVVTNAGPLIALGKLNRLDLLGSLFGEVQAPSAVYKKVVTQGLARGASDARVVQLFWQQQQWPIVDVPETTLAAYVPSVILDPGEIEALAFPWLKWSYCSARLQPGRTSGSPPSCVDRC